MPDTESATRHIRVETSPGARAGVALVTLERPEALNALSFALLAELADALEVLDRDGSTRVVVLTGSGQRAFAAGADVAELRDQTPASLRADGHFGAWDRISAVGLPLIAAVRGYALGGGCELAMSCDLIIAADDARFGQPEIKIGIMPGAGGTQRLTRAIGPARAMDMILTGRPMPAAEALAAGLVSRVVPAATLLDDALAVAVEIAAMPPGSVRAAKQAVRAAQELPLSDGLALERRVFFDLFATHDQREGMSAFLEKRPAVWQDGSR